MISTIVESYFQVACGWDGEWLPLRFADEKSADLFVAKYCCHSKRGHLIKRVDV